MAALVALFTAGTASATGKYDVNHDGHVRGVVLFVGDSNETLGASEIAGALTTRPDGYLPVISSRAASGIRFTDCVFQACGPGFNNYWEVRLGNVLARVTPNAVVINLGVNDMYTQGTCDMPGWACYGQKIDWLLRSLPSTIPIFWTNLPCSIEPPSILQACHTVNLALARAPARHRNLHVLNWALRASSHPTWLQKNNVHLTTAGCLEWAAFVVRALDARISGA